MRYVRVASSGTVDRKELCRECGEQMFYHMNDRDEIDEVFCGNLGNCVAALVNILKEES